MCKGYVAHSASVDAKFVGTSSSWSNDSDIHLRARKEVPTVEPENGSIEVNADGSGQRDNITTTAKPEPETTTYPQWHHHERELEEYIFFRRPVNPVTRPPVNPVTRLPLPNQFSAGSFQIVFNVTQNMSPSCRMLVYYVRNRETIADSKVIDIEDSSANKVGKPINHAPQWSSNFCPTNSAKQLE